MLKNIAKDYAKLFSSILKLFFLILLCVLTSAIVVFPLWKLASVSPDIYTIITLSVIALLALFFAVKKIKTAGVKKTLLFLFNFIIIAGGLISIFTAVIYGKKILALPVFILMIFLYGISTSLKKHQPFPHNDRF